MTLRVALALLAILPTWGRTAAQVPLSSSDLRLPTDAAGGGTLAVRLLFPADAADYRYEDGAPVVVYLPGGFGPGNLGAGARIAQQGFVVLSFVYPGGVTPDGSSDGVYDYRGDGCQRALRDVIRFAEGAAQDSLGRSIDDVVPGPVHPGIVGLAPYSNGLIGLITLDRYGAAVPYAPYQCGWENPTSGQIVTGDLGANGEDCDSSFDGDGNGLPGDDAKNSWYDPATGYGPTSFVVDYSLLAWDSLVPGTYTDTTGRCPPVSRAGATFLDGLTNGRLDFRTGSTGCLDVDGDGMLEPTEDWRFRGITTFDLACRLKVHYSGEVTRAARDHGLFATGWPPWIASVEESSAFWDLRDATAHWDGIASRFPDFRAIAVFTKQDHVQSQDDHPHVRHVLDGMTARGLWYRINADASYYLDVNGSLPVGYAETDAGVVILPGSMKSHGEPVGTRSDDMQAAGHAEMADRVHSGCWWPDLRSTLRPSFPPAPESTELNLGPGKSRVSWAAAAGAFCYDVLRGDLAALADDGSHVMLGGASCVEEDSPDTESTDAEDPLPGSGFYYVVKPNGVHGSYGSGSSGRPRADPDRACK